MTSPVLRAKGFAKHLVGITALTGVHGALHEAEMVGDSGADNSTLASR